MVIDSEAESISSLESLETADQLLGKFLGFTSQKKDVNKADRDTYSKPGVRTKQTAPNFRAMSERQGKKYKYSLESLVMGAVDDDEAEASVAKARALLGGRDDTTTTSDNKSETEGGATILREDVLVSALSADDQGTDIQRLLNAVKRTEALEQEKSWSFFTVEAKQELPEFPKYSIDPSSREAFLRESYSRDRAFNSGIIDFALSKQRLPDEVFMWILKSVPCERRDALRYAHCRAITFADHQRIATLIGPSDIDELFLSLGSSPTAININETIVPNISSCNSDNSSRDWKCLVSVVDLLRDISDHLRVETKVHALRILFRLSLDTTLANKSVVIASLESAIDSLFQSIPLEDFQEITRPIGVSAFNTANNTTFQTRLLERILPTNPLIAHFRGRLAMAFLFSDSSLLEKSNEEILGLKQVIRYLKETRLDTKLRKARTANDYDYDELKAITTLLNIAIDTGGIKVEFPNKEAEREFNADVDTLADNLKQIFSAIEDSGASHLKRTDAKQGLEALHWRILYSVRTKPPSKSIFGQGSWEQRSSKQFDGWARKSSGQNVIKADVPVT